MITSPNFPWYFNLSNSSSGYRKMFKRDNLNSCFSENIQFTHLFFLEGKIMTTETYFDEIKLLIETIENKFYIKNSNKNILYKIKMNLLLPSKNDNKNTCNIPHTDLGDGDSNTALYYINDCDGDTVIFKENIHNYQDKLNKDITISPKMGRTIFFDSSTYHTSSCPLNSEYRAVINIVYHS